MGLNEEIRLKKLSDDDDDYDLDFNITVYKLPSRRTQIQLNYDMVFNILLGVVLVLRSYIMKSRKRSPKNQSYKEDQRLSEESSSDLSSFEDSENQWAETEDAFFRGSSC